MDVEPLRILLVGSGGREHALCWKLAKSPRVEVIHVCPGNGGTELVPKTRNVSTVSPDDFSGLLAFCREQDVNFVVPGPEVPLVNGIGSFFRAAGIRCFGPTKAAARMEGSKTFSKDFMAKYNIPTARYKNFNNYEKARQYLDGISHNVVLKATGLAAGKGVILPASKEEAYAALDQIMSAKDFGPAGDEVVIEECKALPGVFTLCLRSCTTCFLEYISGSLLSIYSGISLAAPNPRPNEAVLTPNCASFRRSRAILSEFQ